MRKSFFLLAALALLTGLGLTGCPWSKSPNVFDGAKGVSWPKFGGPPPQTEPPLEDAGQPSRSRSSGADSN